MTKLTNTLYMIIAVLAIVASQSATAQLHTTSSASLATEPTAVAPAADVAPVQTAKVGHYGYTSSQSYTPSATSGSSSAPVVSPVAKQGKLAGGVSAQNVFGSSSEKFSTRQTNSVAPLENTVNNSVVGGLGDEFTPPGNPYPGGVVPVGNGTWALALLLLAYAAFIAVRKARKEA